MKILDVTLRDGGFANDFSLDGATSRRIACLLDDAGLDGIELGYLTGLPANHGHYASPGPCIAWPIAELAELIRTMRTPAVAMLHPAGPVQRTRDELAALARAGLDLVRVPLTPGKRGDWHRSVELLQSAGLRFALNLTLATWCNEQEVEACARMAEQRGAAVFYVADTNSAYLPGQVRGLFRRLREAVSIPLGFHPHDGKQLAMANVMASLEGGAEWVDGSLCGLGRGAGNAVTEILHEIDGRNAAARNRLLRALPAVAEAFSVSQQQRLWHSLCGFLDLWPPTISQIEERARARGCDPYPLAARALLGVTLPRPLPEQELDRLLSQAEPQLDGVDAL